MYQYGETVIARARKGGSCPTTANLAPQRKNRRLTARRQYALISHPQFLQGSLFRSLWAYWPAGTCWYDDIRFEEVGPLAAEAVRHREKVTHLGLEARLGDGNDANVREGGGFDKQQIWIDAVNAWKENNYEESLRLAERLIAHEPNKGDYRLLAARILVKLKRWSQADIHVRWLLEKSTPANREAGDIRRVEPWQRDWATVVRGEILLRTGRQDEAEKMLRTVLETAGSPHAREAAKALLAQLKQTD